jgi:bifunctional ADP-heptose synthase (sugar kinase/adenylyltransferase)
MAWWPSMASHKPVEIPIHGSDEVADVTGAGDTVIATFTAATRRRSRYGDSQRGLPTLLGAS